MNFVEGSEVSFAYGNKVIIERSDFTMPDKGVTTVIGPNGSGKTTLLNGIAGIIKPASGYLKVCNGYSDCSWEHVSYVMQSLNFPKGAPVTVREVVGMGLYTELGLFKRKTQAHRELIESALERMEIINIADSHLDELSGGQQQRVFIAQGLVQPHKALILDEPLNGLDLVSARIIDDVIHEIQHEGLRTVILTTHNLAEAHASDHVVLMNKKVVACGKPDEVLTQENLELAYGLSRLHNHPHNISLEI